MGLMHMRLIATLIVLLFAAPVLSAGDAQSGKALSAVCAACHGQDGNTAISPDYPNLAGQNEIYLTRQLEMIKSNERDAPLMAGQLANHSAQQLADLAAYYAGLPGKVGAATNENLALGERIYRGGILAKGVAACSACHSPTGRGMASAGFPRVSGQAFDYMVVQLKAYREGERATDEAYNGMMRAVAANMTDGEIRAVANYIRGLH